MILLVLPVSRPKHRFAFRRGAVTVRVECCNAWPIEGGEESITAPYCALGKRVEQDVVLVAARSVPDGALERGLSRMC